MKKRSSCLLKKFAIIVATITSFVLIVLLFILITTSIQSYKTIEIKVPEIESFFYVTQVRTGALFKNIFHYKFYIDSKRKTKKEMKNNDNRIIFIGSCFGYYTAGADTLCLDGELYYKADFKTINGAKVIIRDYAHISEQCSEFVYDTRYNTLVPKDELGKVIFVTDADFEHVKAFRALF